MTYYFGHHWGAPMLDHATQLPAPVDQCCFHCEEPIAECEQGLLQHTIRSSPTGPVGTVEPVRRECDIRLMLGDMNHLAHNRICGAHPDIEPAELPAAPYATPRDEAHVGAVSWDKQR